MLEPSELFPEVDNLYEFLSIHAGMLFDEERVAKYSDAIQKVVKKGDIVADIGAGTGLFAFLCLEAGAARVHAIERSQAIKWAQLLAEKNGFADRIVFHHQDSRFCDLPEQVNVVVSELIGHIAFEEGMAESLFDAKTRFLSQDGKIIPRAVSLVVVPVHEKEIYEECINCWQEVWGIDYSLLRKDALQSCYIKEFSNENLMAVPETILTLDFMEGQEPAEFRRSLEFMISRAGEVNGIGVWFDAELSPGVQLSSGPWKRTHWQQTFCPITAPLRVNPGEKVNVEMQMRLRSSECDSFHFEFSVNKGGWSCQEEV